MCEATQQSVPPIMRSLLGIMQDKCKKSEDNSPLRWKMRTYLSKMRAIILLETPRSQLRASNYSEDANHAVSQYANNVFFVALRARKACDAARLFKSAAVGQILFFVFVHCPRALGSSWFHRRSCRSWCTLLLRVLLVVGGSIIFTVATSLAWRQQIHGRPGKYLSDTATMDSAQLLLEFAASCWQRIGSQAPLFIWSRANIG